MNVDYLLYIRHTIFYILYHKTGYMSSKIPAENHPLRSLRSLSGCHPSVGCGIESHLFLVSL